jgi:transposase
VRRAKESLLAPFVKFCRMVERHEGGILRYSVKHVASGLSKGMNNKIKVVKRRAYGYRDPGHFILKTIPSVREDMVRITKHSEEPHILLYT